MVRYTQSNLERLMKDCMKVRTITRTAHSNLPNEVMSYIESLIPSEMKIQPVEITDLLYGMIVDRTKPYLIERYEQLNNKDRESPEGKYVMEVINSMGGNLEQDNKKNAFYNLTPQTLFIEAEKEMPVRIKNLLINYDLNFVGDILQFESKSHLRRIPGMGKVSLNILVETLNIVGEKYEVEKTYIGQKLQDWERPQE